MFFRTRNFFQTRTGQDVGAGGLDIHPHPSSTLDPPVTKGQQQMSVIEVAPEAVHKGADELPFVDIGGGNKMKVIMVDEGQGLWIIENIFQAGFEVMTHKHTGPVYGYTVSGAWKYKEYDYVNRAGSFLFEPAGSIHTLTCIEDDTQVWFQMYGCNLNLDDDGNIASISDGAGSLAAYYALCEAAGLPRPAVVVR